MAWLQGRSPAEELKRLQRSAPRLTADQGFAASRRSGTCVHDSLGEIADSESVERVYPRPA
eukprot:13855284-Alexandrium_andersonii.AAC.1